MYSEMKRVCRGQCGKVFVHLKIREQGLRMKQSSLIYHEEYQILLKTLLAYQKAGISLTVEGKAKSAEDIADLCVFREAGAYMRDYIQDERGKLIEIRFDKITSDI